MKSLNVIVLLALLTISSLSINASCNNGKNNRNKNDRTSINTDITEDTTRDVVQFKNTWNNKMDQLENKINKWGNKVDSLSGRKKEQARIKLDSLKAQRDRLKDKIDHASEHTGAQWDQFKQEVSDSYDSLSEKIGNAFKE